MTGWDTLLYKISGQQFERKIWFQVIEIVIYDSKKCYNLLIVLSIKLLKYYKTQ